MNVSFLSSIHFLRLLSLLVMALIANLTQGQITVIDTFNYTGSVQTFTVPAGVDSITLDLRGAQGGMAYYCGTVGGSGGYGGRTTGTINVSPGDVVYIYVGGKGGNAASSSGGSAGYNGGAYGNNYTTDQAGGGGGGATDLRLNGTALTNRIAVAGGGGGAASGACIPSNGGHAGGLTGTGGTNCCSGVNPTGGSQSGGGSGGYYSGYCTASSGSLGYGGAACSPSGGGGGGGGYYGGGGGAWASGGGGSSYITTSAVNYALTSASNTGNGIAYITYKRCALPTIADPISYSPHSRQVTFSSVNVNGTGNNVAFVSPGESITLAFNYAIVQNGTYCPGCVSQYYVGIYGFWQDCFKNSNGYCNCSGSESYTITAPTTPGIYYFTQGRTLNYTCSSGNTTVSSGTDGLAAIVVRETYSGTVTDESCVGDNNGSVVVLPDSATTGNTYNWSTGNTTNTLSTVGAGTYTVTSSDSYGCFQIDTFEVFTDTTAPVADAFESTTIYLDASGNVTVSAATIDSASSDACSMVFSLSDSVFNCADTGTQNVSFYATDPGGLIGSDAITFTVVDTVLPDVITQPVTLNLGASGSAVLIASSVDNGSSDACGIDVMSLSKDTFTCSDIGSNTVTLYVRDVNGNVDSGNATVTVVDNVAPTVIAKNLNLYLGSGGIVSIAAADLDSASYDNCGIDTFYASATVFTCADIGSNSVTLYASDAYGNVDSASTTVSVLDTTTPSLLLYSSKTIYLDSSGMATINIDTLDSATSDNCNYNLSFTSGYSGPLNIANGTTTGGVASIVKYESGSGAVNYRSSIGTVCNENWYALGSLCDEGSTVNSPDTSYKGNTNSGATWSNATPGTSYGILVIDLASVKSIEAMSVFQMFSDGKTTHIRAFSHPSSDTISPATNDAGWSEFLTSTAVGAGAISSGYAYNPLKLSFNNIQSRYVKLYLYNSGAYGSSGYIELRSVKIFGSATTKTYNCSDVGSQSLTVHATDTSGNADSADVNVIVMDTVRPIVAAQTATIYLGAFGIGTINAASIDSGSSDACGIDSLYLSKDTFYCSDIGTNVVTLYAIDVNGNIDSAHTTVYVYDTVAPTVFPKVINVYLDSQGVATVEGYMLDSASWDTCGIDTFYLSVSSFNCSDIGANSVTLFAVDQTGNVGSSVTTLFVLDTIAPSIEMASTNIYLDSFGLGVISPSTLNTGTWDSCGISSLTINYDTFNCLHVNDSFYVTLTAIDNNGNSISDSVLVYVYDTIGPKMATHNDTLYLDSFGLGSIVASQIDNGSWDSCGIDSLWLNNNSFGCADVGINTVTLFASDIYGNVSSLSASILVLDTVAPKVITQNITVYLNTNGQYTLSPSEVDNGSWDSCGISSLAVDISNFSCADVSTPTTVILTVTDVNGNSSQATADVTTVDTVVPVIIPKNITLTLNSSGLASIDAIDIDSASWDSCGIDTMFLNMYDFNCANVGSNSVLLYAVDMNGNIDSAQATVTIQDLTPPVVVPQNITVALNGSGSVIIAASQIDSASSDSCGIDSMWLDNNAFGCANVGSNTVTLYAMDVNGNVDSAQSTVTVIDTIAPNLYLQNITVYLDSFGEITISATDIDSASYDACGIISLSLNDSVFNCANIGAVNAVILTAVDVNGNANSDTAYVNVLDTIAPEVITNNLSVYLDSTGSVSITEQDINSNTWDSCGVDTIYLDNYDFDCSNVGNNTVVLTAIDIYNNSNSNTATVTVFDTIAPEVITQNIIVYLNSTGQYTLSPSEVDNGSWDSCGIASFDLDTSNFSCADTGVFVVALIVTDVNGNVNSGSASVTLLDTNSPTVVTQNVTIYLGSTGNASITVAMIDGGSSDNCEIDTLYLDNYDFDCSDTTSQTVTLTAVDVSGNMDSSTAIVSILDTSAPVIQTQNLTLYLDENGIATISASDVNNGTSDNCAVDSIWLSDTLFECVDTTNTQIISFFAKDVSGNVSSGAVNIDIYDTISPTVSAQNLTIYLDSFGNANIFPSQVDSNSLDNCGIDSTWISQNNFTCSNVGDTVTVLLYIKDNSGNIASGSSSIITLDSTAPQVITQNISVYLDSFGSVSIDTSMINNGSWDACGIDTLYLDQYTFTCSDIGTNSVELFAIDVHGNIGSLNATVTVYDTIAPQIILQPILVYLDSFGSASITTNDLNNGSWDSCGIATMTIDTADFTCLSHGDTIPVHFTAIDVNGNTSIDSTYVVILDTLAPVVWATSTTVYLDSNGQFNLDVNAIDSGTFDNCTLTSIYLSDSIFDCSHVDSTWGVWFVAIDSFGNADSMQIQITVLDTIYPTIICNDSLIVNNDTGQCGRSVSFQWPVIWDNCSIDTLVQIDTTGLDSGMFFPVGITELIYAVIDQSGNSDTCSFIVEVRDVEAPSFICYDDTSICDSIFTFITPNYLDNCSGLDVVQLEGIESGQPYPVGITVNTFTVSDLYGNSDTCSFEVLRFDYTSSAVAGADQLLCEIPSTNLAATPPTIGVGAWNQVMGAATIANPLQATTSISGLDTGTYVFEWAITNGVCPIERDTMKVVNFSNAAVINAGLDQVLCDTSSTHLTATATVITAGYWTSSNSSVSISDSLDPTSLVTGLTLGEYTFIWNVKNGVCPAGFDSVTVSVHPFPVVTAAEDAYIFPPSSVELKANSDIATLFEWFTSAGSSVGAMASVDVSPITTTVYYVIGATDAGCTSTDTMMVEVNVELEIPTAFTPDNDGYNDVWNIKELANYPDCNVSIYNRWGNKMFESDGYNTPWDGTFNGESLPSGAYFFVINLNVGEIKPLTGSITIIK